MRVLIIGIDGFSWNVLGPLLEAGELPHLAKLARAGVRGEMDNLGQTESPIIWTTIATGKHPDQHRILGFTGMFGRRWPLKGRDLPWFKALPRVARRAMLRLGMAYEGSVRSFQRKVKALWNMADEGGLSAGMASWWASHPPEPVRGFNVSDLANYALLVIRSQMGLGDMDEEARMGLDNMVHPPHDPGVVSSWFEIDDERILQMARDFAPIDDEEGFLALDTFRRDEPLSVLKFSIYQDNFAVRALTGMREEIGYQPDLMGLYLGGADAVSHTFWKYLFPEDFTTVEPEKMARFGDTIRSYYRYVDSMVGELLGCVDEEETVVIAMSDHGFESVPEGEGAGQISGSHDNAPPGVFLARGPGMKAGAQADTRSIDLAPTVLHLLGLPVGRDMPGRVVREAIADELLEERPVRFIPTWEGGDERAKAAAVDEEAVDQKVLDRLKTLGYFD